MAGRWSSEHFVAEFRDLQASAMAVDCLGNWVLLAGRKNLAFVDLSRPSQTVVKVTRQSKWDIGCVQWNGQPSHSHRFVTACNQRLDVFDYRDASASHLCSMKAHSRTVSDVDWSPFDVNIVASCSVDTFTYFWDIRDSKKPVKSFQTVSGAYQVKWNKVTNNLFATTHDGDVRIWDPRKGNSPIQYISAHPSKIHGLDWCHKDQYKLVTASQDCTIRFWDYNTPRRSETMINSGNPVWRARYTPFGDGVMSVVVPQLRRGENSLSLWHQSNNQKPVHIFVGHKDVILDFQWRRKQHDSARDQQLVTWSKDQTLRLWNVDTAMQKLCGHEVGEVMDEVQDDDLLPMSATARAMDSMSTQIDRDNKPVTSSSSNLLRPADSVSSNSSAMTGSSSTVFVPLEREIENLSGGFPGVHLKRVDFAKRKCSFKLERSVSFMDIELFFPANYPMKICPALTIIQSNLDKETQARVVKTFGDVSTKLVNQLMNCVETSLRQILPIMEKSRPYSSPQDGQSREDRKTMLENKYHVEKVKSPSSPISPSSAAPMYPTGSFQDSSVPFPRTSGARFCSNDRLVVFSVPAFLKKVHEDMEVTPRALSDLVTCTQSQWIRSQPSFSLSMLYGSPPPTVPAASISDFFTEKHAKSKNRQSHLHHHHKSQGRSRDAGEPRPHKEKDAERQSKKLQKVGAINIYDISSINPLSKYLAENYKLDLQDIPGTCDHNAAVAMKIGRKDLVQLWKLIHQMSHPVLRPSPNVELGPPWAYHPFGRGMVEKFLSHYGQVRDVQTMAMICCMFWDKDPPMMDLVASGISRQESRLSFEYAAANGYDYEVAEPISSAAPTPPRPLHMVSPAPLSPQQVLPPPTLPPPPPMTSSSSSCSASAGLAKSKGRMGEVASQPNLAALFRAAVMKSKRSLSWSNSYDDIKILEEKDPREREVEKERILHHNNSKMLNPELKFQHEQIKKAYADVLYKWNLLNKRIQILKHTDSTGAPSRGIEFVVSCHNCNEDVQGPQCTRCKYPALRCSICHIGVRGAANFCLACGHGGHMHHMMDWFSSQTVCPTGCGCNCLQENLVPDGEQEIPS